MHSLCAPARLVRGPTEGCGQWNSAWQTICPTLVLCVGSGGSDFFPQLATWDEVTLIFLISSECILSSPSILHPCISGCPLVKLFKAAYNSSTNLQVSAFRNGAERKNEGERHKGTGGTLIIFAPRAQALLAPPSYSTVCWFHLDNNMYFAAAWNEPGVSRPHIHRPCSTSLLILHGAFVFFNKPVYCFIQNR